MKFEDIPLDTPAFHNVSGMPGAGKGVLDTAIADRLHQETGKPVYLSMLEGRRKPALPQHVNTVEGIDFPTDCVAIMMDAHLQAHARRFQTPINVTLDKMHGQLRHDNIDYIFDTQSLAGIDRNNVLRSNYRWYKKPYGKESELGRVAVKEEVELASEKFSGRSRRYIWEHAWLYIDTLIHDWEGLVSGIQMPEWYTDEISRMHRRSGPGRVVIR